MEDKASSTTRQGNYAPPRHLLHHSFAAAAAALPQPHITLLPLPTTQPCPCLCCSVIQPQALGDLHLAVVVLLAFLGAWFGTVLGGAYVGETYTFYLSSGLPIPNPMYWKASEG